jgi:tetratricopeptide (TPR) repeat protein
MIVNIGKVPSALSLSFHFRPKLFLPCCISLILVFLLATACFRKNIRVVVSPEDLAKANSLLREGDVAFERRDFYAALIKYLDASRLNPNDSSMWNRLGIAYSQLKYYDEGIDAFKHSIDLNSKYANSVNNLGSAYFARREFKKAEKNFKKAIRMDSKDATFHMNLGSLYFERKKVNEALVEWRKGLALNPDILTKSNAISMSIEGENTLSKDKAFIFARIYALAGNTLRSIEFLEQALKDGFSDINAIQRQPDFDRIRNDEQFIKFMKDALFWASPKL